MKFDTGEFLLGDCLELMKHIPDNSVHMVLCDLPYGMTNAKWDSVIPMDKLWVEYWRVLKDDGIVCLTSIQPFTTQLINSQIDAFKYDLVWVKNKSSGFLNAKRQPLRNKEDIVIFYKKSPTYNPIMGIGPRRVVKSGKRSQSVLYNQINKPDYDSTKRYPTQILEFPVVNNGSKERFHPTQKPVALFEYLIKTYTNEGETVLDNTAGSGTTAVAAIRSNRKWICIEYSEEYYTKACERVKKEEIKVNLGDFLF